MRAGSSGPESLLDPPLLTFYVLIIARSLDLHYNHYVRACVRPLHDSENAHNS